MRSTKVSNVLLHITTPNFREGFVISRLYFWTISDYNFIFIIKFDKLIIIKHAQNAWHLMHVQFGVFAGKIHLIFHLHMLQIIHSSIYVTAEEYIG